MSAKPQFRFTTDPGSGLLYYGDQFIAKFNAEQRTALASILAAHYDDFTGDYTVYDNFSREDLIAQMEHHRDRAHAANTTAIKRGIERDAALAALKLAEPHIKFIVEDTEWADTKLAQDAHEIAKGDLAQIRAALANFQK